MVGIEAGWDNSRGCKGLRRKRGPEEVRLIRTSTSKGYMVLFGAVNFAFGGGEV
jgi:hypothetical protein